VNESGEIITVTPNTAIDRTLFIEDFHWNKTIRSFQSVIGMGGKATDASWILGELGYPNTAMGFAAGVVGRQMDRMLRKRGCKTDFVWVKGETRTNIVIIGSNGQGQSTLVSGGLAISPQDCKRLYNKYTRAIKDASCIIIGGSIPDGVDFSLYTEMVRAAGKLEIPTIFDASGPGLLAGMQGRPNFVKPNIEEIEDLSGRKVTNIRSAYEEARKLQEKYGTSLIITLGELGALAVLPDRAYQIPPVKLEVVSSAGAGDGVLAGLAAALSRGKSIEEGLQLGFAIAAAVCLTPATADCRREDVEELTPKIRLIPFH
jgi:1-phosphofructokinase family hexose kinase